MVVQINVNADINKQTLTFSYLELCGFEPHLCIIAIVVDLIRPTPGIECFHKSFIKYFFR